MSRIRFKSTGIFILKMDHNRIEDSFNRVVCERIFFEGFLV